MARPKKVVTDGVQKPETENLNSVEETKTTSVSENDLIRDLLRKIEQLEKRLNNEQAISKDVTVENPVSEIEAGEDIDLDIRSEKYIKVMSLSEEKLNLTTESYGRGKVFSFPKFGTTRQIMYAELVDIIHNQQSFLEDGRFYIMDEKVIRKHGLLEAYETILDKNKIEKVLACNTKDSIAFYKAANEHQRQLIAQMLVSRIKNGSEVDLNVVAAISKIAGFDINKMAEEAIQFERAQQQTEDAS